MGPTAGGGGTMLHGPSSAQRHQSLSTLVILTSLMEMYHRVPGIPESSPLFQASPVKLRTTLKVAQSLHPPMAGKQPRPNGSWQKTVGAGT